MTTEYQEDNTDRSFRQDEALPAAHGPGVNQGSLMSPG